MQTFNSFLPAIMFRSSPSNRERQEDQVPILVNESIEDDILSSEQHVAGSAGVRSGAAGKCDFVCLKVAFKYSF